MKGIAAKLGAIVLITVGLSLGEAGARSGQTADAADWRYYYSNTGVRCEGCCPSTEICCTVDFPCSVTPVD